MRREGCFFLLLVACCLVPVFRLLPNACFDRDASLGRELEGVVDQVAQDVLQLGAVGAYDRQAEGIIPIKAQLFIDGRLVVQLELVEEILQVEILRVYGDAFGLQHRGVAKRGS